MINRLTVSVFLIKQDEVWSAQCLDHDVCSQAKTIHGAVEELGRMLAAESLVQESIGQSLEDIAPAPDSYWAEFAQAAILHTIASPVLRIEDHAPPAFMLPQFNELRVA